MYMLSGHPLNVLSLRFVPKQPQSFSNSDHFFNPLLSLWHPDISPAMDTLFWEIIAVVGGLWLIVSIAFSTVSTQLLPWSICIMNISFRSNFLVCIKGLTIIFTECISHMLSQPINPLQILLILFIISVSTYLRWFRNEYYWSKEWFNFQSNVNVKQYMQWSSHIILLFILHLLMICQEFMSFQSRFVGFFFPLTGSTRIFKSIFPFFFWDKE